jgi:thioredoxin-related protein
MRKLQLAFFAVVAAWGGTLAWSQEAATEAKATADAKKPEIYDEKADARVLVERAVAEAKRDHSRVLVMFGGNWCGWCHKLHDVLKKNAELEKLVRYEYQLVMVDTKAKNADVLMKEYEVDQQAGVPYLLVLDGAGRVVTRQETASLEEGDHHDPVKVRDFLSKHQDKAPAAKEVLAAALAQASSEGKRVFLHFGAPGCGWCHKLDDFLARPEVAAIIAKDFIDLKVDTDRMSGGQELLEQYCKKPGGIPWFVFLDAEGKAVVDSDSTQGNVGYPVEPHEIAHFIAMLKQSVRRADAAEIAKLQQTLETIAKEIKGARAATSAAANSN